MSSLPQELIEAIVDHLHDDALSLKACACVSRIWTHRCRIHLLHRGVVLNLQDATVGPSDLERKIKEEVTAFQHVLSTQPSMAEHVHSLEIGNLIWRLSEEWTNLLVDVMKPLLHVQHLTFRKVRWYFLPAALEKAFTAILRLPTLVSLSFDELTTSGPSTLPCLLILPPNLKDMQISQFRCIDNTSEASLPSSNEKSFHPLASLSISLGTAVQATGLLQLLFGRQNPPYDVKHLRRLCISDTCTSDSIQFLWEATRLTLEEYEVVGRSPRPNASPIFTTSLWQLPCLRRLIVPSTYLESLTESAFANNPNNPHPLEDLHIRSINLNPVSIKGLDKLDGILANLALGSLHRVELQVSNISWTASSCLLPRLQGRGVEIIVISESGGR